MGEDERGNGSGCWTKCGVTMIMWVVFLGIHDDFKWWCRIQNSGFPFLVNPAIIHATAACLMEVGEQKTLPN